MSEVNILKRKNEIKSIILYSDKLLKDIVKLHEELLLGEEKKLEFQISIKFFLELMSSCLDYLAMDIFELYSYPIEDKKRIYFPFIKYRGNEEMIDSEKRLAESICRNINQNASEDLSLVHKIRNYQHLYYQNHNIWASDFKKLRNNNTHRNLSLYEEKIDNDRIINGMLGDGKIIFKGESSGIRVLGDEKYSSTKEELEKFFNRPVGEKITKYYIFLDVSNINQETIKFLESIRQNVDKIIDDIYSFLESKTIL